MGLWTSNEITRRKDFAHCLADGKSSKKFLLFSVSGVSRRKGSTWLSQTVEMKGGRVWVGVLGISLTPTSFPSFSLHTQVSSVLGEKKKSSQGGSIHFCNYTSFIDWGACFCLFLRRTGSHQAEPTQPPHWCLQASSDWHLLWAELKTPRVEKLNTSGKMKTQGLGKLRIAFQKKLLNNDNTLIGFVLFLTMKLGKTKVDLVFIIKSLQIGNYANKQMKHPRLFLKTKVSRLLESYHLIQCKCDKASLNKPWCNIWGSKLEKWSCECGEAARFLAHAPQPHQSFFRRSVIT